MIYSKQGGRWTYQKETLVHEWGVRYQDVIISPGFQVTETNFDSFISF